eukprot:TRINITY_DN105529_c0_g1_i1.p1 TRINITY_DN105529_c0_g1~~TRINITY_DN105529_c0_g1_i1.p1  ORF type:complete len:584 (+),score=82.80 TRINITY_DN105529_c0_g1_i1:89-1840(+)
MAVVQAARLPVQVHELREMLKGEFESLAARLTENLRAELCKAGVGQASSSETVDSSFRPHPWTKRHMRRYLQAEVDDQENEEDGIEKTHVRKSRQIHPQRSLGKDTGSLSLTADSYSVDPVEEIVSNPVEASVKGRPRNIDIDAPQHGISLRASFTPEGHVSKRVEQAMGLGSMPSSASLAIATPSQRCAHKFVRSQTFEWLMVLTIATQTILVGMQIDDMAKSNLHNPPAVYRVFDVITCVIFTIELALRLYIHRGTFFYMRGWAFNLLDLILIVSQILEEVLLLSTGTVGSGINFTLLRLVRMLRCVRIMKVLRLTRFFDDLRNLVACIVYSTKSFVWSFLFVFLLIYIFGIYLTQSVHLHRLEVGVNAKGDDELQKWFGSVGKAILSLFEGLTGGVDWNDLVQPLMEYMHPGWGVATVLWMSFLILAVMNIINGVFVSSAIELSQRVKAVDNVFYARRLFKCLDRDESGAISTDEIHSHLESRAVKDFFRSIDVDVHEAESLFEILDVSGDGVIDCDEFISGCLRLQGQARALDLILMTLDNRRGFEHTAFQLSAIQASVQKIQQQMGMAQDDAKTSAAK